MTTVSVVIPCFNAGRWIGATLASVAGQTLPALEIIVVDDGSTDGSAEVARRAVPGVRLVQTEHSGPSRARNIGTGLAQGNFIQYLDADDLLASDKLARQVHALERSEADVAYGDWSALVMREDGGAEPEPRVSHQMGDDPEIALFTDFWCPPAAYLFRREVVEATGGWNEQLPVIQDARFVLDCALHGARFVYSGGVAAYYRVHSGDSLSTRDPIAFTRDCFRNALDIDAWWRQHGGLTKPRGDALLKVYGQVARASFRTDAATFEAAYAALRSLQPGYTPAHPWHLALASHVIGYRRAEALAVHYRRVKQTISR
jgi:glycosyltransferase involved in cell wall biosynthesis